MLIGYCNEHCHTMSLLPDSQNCGLRMHRECRGRFPRPRLQRKPLVSDPGVPHVPGCMSGLLTSVGGENVPGITGACATRNFTYLLRGSWASCDIHWYHVHPLAPRRCGSDFKCLIFKLIIKKYSFGNRCETAIWWMPRKLIIMNSSLVQTMAWCSQAKIHYLVQCWTRST